MTTAGPYNTRPGRAAVIFPSSNATCPFTITCVTPTAYWCGCSNVALSATARLRDVSEALAVERMIPSAPREVDVVRIAAAALLADEPRGFLLQLVAHRHILQAVEDRVAPALERVRRHQRRLDARRRRRVRILIERRVDAARARLVDQLQRVDRPAPVRLADHLVMRDLRRQPAFLADLDRLLHAVEDAVGLAAHVRDVDAAHPAGHFRELDDFGSRREGPPHVEEPGATTRPPASTTRAAGASIRGAMRAIVSPRTATSPRYHGLPVPSTMRPLRIRRS